MKTNKFTHAFRALCSVVTILILITSLGCSDSSPSSTNVSQAPQGELIQGDPIETAQETQLSTPAIEGAPDTKPANVATDHTGIRTTEIPVDNSSVVESNEATQATGQVVVTASEPEVLLEIVKEGADLISKDGDYLSISFDKLASFEYTMPEDLTEPVADEEGQVYKEQIPASIKALNDKPISLKGFMLPLKVEKGSVTEMLIMRDQSMCCYGTVPKINEWVSVRMEEEGVKPVMDEPVTIYGTLKVGEVLENGYLVGIYEMDGQSMSVEKIDQ